MSTVTPEKACHTPMASLKQVPVTLSVVTVLMGLGTYRSEDLFICCVCHGMIIADIGGLSVATTGLQR